MTRHELAAHEQRSLAEIARELDIVHIASGSALDRCLPQIWRLLGTESALITSPVETTAGLVVERYHVAGLTDPTLVKQLLEAFFTTAPTRYAWYDVARPEVEQRNRVLEMHDLVGPGELERSAVYERVLLPARLHAHRQPRILLCEGASLLGWFGAFHEGKVTARHRTRLARLAPIIRRRLRLERRLGSVPYVQAALEAALERLGAPAYVVDARGRIRHTNKAGHALLSLRAGEVRAALRDRLAGRHAALAFELSPLRETGVPPGHLAVLVETTRDARIEASLARATERWQLTRQQRNVLSHVVRGHANATIAAALQVTVRAVELHVSTLLDRVGVDSRAALVASVLLG
jgi:DNA-binding CsgD family transcriptional regulator